MRKWYPKIKSWLFPGVLILFILGTATMPAVYSYTYSGRSQSPNHILTYTKNKLTWDRATGINKDGAAEMDLFDVEYPNVQSQNGENVIAPGTGKTSIVRLKNDVAGTIQYTAALYRITTNENLPLNITLTGSDFTPTSEYALPQGISEDQVITAVKGSVGGNQIQDFDVAWDWCFYEDDVHDSIDTALGNKESLDKVTVGLYIQVEDDNAYIPPDTGDSTPFGTYLILMLISGAVLAVLLMERKRESKDACS